ncbi:enoyl-CoA hydratase-related protein [Streptomyces olivoreticuli]|uniref:enoyl-CoA hydratase-related protein n=1 Tax=Streptomyces olivoreticuli TaxID=68246 RepID=UPI00265A98D7|nr:enoyl-CoA hydratase-related protein [Streptomyces olivoreticuli]WKK23505.1 enoyl-CoA hydratase-related protein [Streptomyces olivoreticuli]
MNILLLADAFDSLTQRVYAELGDHGHSVVVEQVPHRADVAGIVGRHRPELILAPVLTAVVPREVRSAYPCLVVHPGPAGDRGPSSVDRAVHEGVREWGVTVSQAVEETGAGDVWATVACQVPAVAKSDLYRNEIADAALEAVRLAVERVASGTYVPVPQEPMARTHPYFRQELRRIDWEADPTETVLRKLRAADSRPGVLDTLLGEEWYLYGGHFEDRLTGAPGELLATRAGALCRATADGAVWIPQLRRRGGPGEPPGLKLPATLALGARLPRLPEATAPLDLADDRCTWTDIRYREDGRTGFLRFSFPGGAMSTTHCRRLLAAYRYARSRPVSVLVLGGGRDFFSNGIHLNVIEAAADPAEESWANINAMDDLVHAVLTTTDRLVVSALGGNAAAGGVMLALAADEVWCRAGVVLNPHYRLMGLYGSEYWTYSLPRRVGAGTAERLMDDALPVSAVAAERIGLVDRVVDSAPGEFGAQVAALAVHLADTPAARARIAAKKAEREQDEARKPLAAHREEELARMRAVLFDRAAPYHARRRAFVRKEPAGRGRRAVGAPGIGGK